MKDITNKLYKRHSLIYKIILFIATTILIAWLFPESARFKYEFKKGKPWQFENLYAPFDFAIKKTEVELSSEKAIIAKNAVKYFNVNTLIYNEVLKAYNNSFDEAFKTIYDEYVFNDLKENGELILSKLYEDGLLDVKYPFSKKRQVVILNENVEKETTFYSHLNNSESIKEIIETALTKNDLKYYSGQLTALFYDIVKPNLTYNKSLSEKVINEQIGALLTNRGQIERGTLIVSKGEVIDDDTYQVLISLELDYQSQVKNVSNTYWILFANIILIALALLMLLLFIKKFRNDVYSNTTKIAFIFFNISLQVVLTTLVINYNVKYLYIVPICISPLVLKAFFDPRLGLLVHVVTILLLGAIVPNSYEYIFLQTIAGIVTVLTVSELHKRVNLFISVAEITLVYIVSYFAFCILQEASVETINYESFSIFIICGLATLFVQPLIYIYEKIFGLVSDLSLLELSDTNTKLLKELSNTAPGTFHHSLSVANLSEAAANEIGANAMLARVGALYHDIGKMKTPKYFTENQATGINAHNELEPKESLKIIIDHVIDGVEIAKKYNLPERIIDFIRTHHGTTMVYYFYKKALELDENIDEKNYRYPGPRPFSKETAIVMMSDSVEAASKSLKEPTAQKIDAFIETIINKKMEDGQFLNSDITFKEIESIKKVLKRKLTNIYHLRVEYPE